MAYSKKDAIRIVSCAAKEYQKKLEGTNLLFIAFCAVWRTLMRFPADSLQSKSHILNYVSMVKEIPQNARH